MTEVSVSDPFLTHSPPLALGECPLWRESDHTLHYLDIDAKPTSILYIVQLEEGGTREVSRREVVCSDTVASIAFRKNTQGSYVCATRQGLAFLDEKTGILTPVKNVLTYEQAHVEDMRCNDGACDSNGRFWFVTQHNGGKNEAKLYRYDPDGTLTQMEEGFAIGNGPVWSPDNSKMYFSFSSQNTSYVYDFDAESGAISNRRVFLENPAATPDGMAVDSEGSVYVAHHGGSCVRVYSPRTVPHDAHSHSHLLKFPAKYMTCPVFGVGPHHSTLFVTSAAEGQFLGEAAILRDKSGAVFRVDMSEVWKGRDVRGIPRHEFAG